VTNPRVVVEVLSRSTESYDRSGKFNRYRELNSFEEYVLIAQDEPLVETFFRQPDGTWLFTPRAGRDAAATLRSLGVELRLADVYAGVEFPPEPGDGRPEVV
jgi:Uma2 family endonuclease